MSLFDRRHRWGPVERQGSIIARTCQSCGRRDEAETLIPEAIAEELLKAWTRKFAMWRRDHLPSRPTISR